MAWKSTFEGPIMEIVVHFTSQFQYIESIKIASSQSPGGLFVGVTDFVKKQALCL